MPFKRPTGTKLTTGPNLIQRHVDIDLRTFYSSDSRSSDLRSSDSYNDRSRAFALSKARPTTNARSNHLISYRSQIAQSLNNPLNTRPLKNICIMKFLRNNI